MCKVWYSWEGDLSLGREGLKRDEGEEGDGEGDGDGDVKLVI